MQAMLAGTLWGSSWPCAVQAPLQLAYASAGRLCLQRLHGRFLHCICCTFASPRRVNVAEGLYCREYYADEM